MVLVCRNKINNKKLHTELDLYIFNNTRKIPYKIINSETDIEYFNNNKNNISNISNKNNEIKLFRKYLKSNNNINANKIYLFDRAYTSYEFIKFLIRSVHSLYLYFFNLKKVQIINLFLNLNLNIN